MVDIKVSDEAIMFDANFKILAGILSNPEDFLAFRFRRVMDTFSILISRKRNDEFVMKFSTASDASLGPMLTK